MTSLPYKSSPLHQLYPSPLTFLQAGEERIQGLKLRHLQSLSVFFHQKRFESVVFKRGRPPGPTGRLVYCPKLTGVAWEVSLF